MLLRLAAAILVVAGCRTAPVPEPTGFLSDYSKLEQVAKGSLRYVDPDGGLGAYRAFILEPVVAHFHAGAGGRSIRDSDLTVILDYARTAMRKAISDRYALVDRSGPGIARVRVALTDLPDSGARGILARELAGGGTASIEAEILDSVTGEQIAALVEACLDNLSANVSIQDSTAAIDGWARRFRQRLDEAHGRSGMPPR